MTRHLHVHLPAMDRANRRFRVKDTQSDAKNASRKAEQQRSIWERRAQEYRGKDMALYDSAKNVAAEFGQAATLYDDAVRFYQNGNEDRAKAAMDRAERLMEHAERVAQSNQFRNR